MAKNNDKYTQIKVLRRGVTLGCCWQFQLRVSSISRYGFWVFSYELCYYYERCVNVLCTQNLVRLPTVLSPSPAGAHEATHVRVGEKKI